MLAPANARPPVRQRSWFAAAALLVVLAVAGFNLLYRLGDPPQPIWDESYYLTASARYELRYASFASHPPLGLMLIAAGDHVAGGNARATLERLAEDKKIAGENVPPGFSYLGVRIASAVFGIAAIGLFFLLMLELGADVPTALGATTPMLFDTALIAQFRAAQLDSFQLCFTVLALWFAARAWRWREVRWMLCFGLACGCAAMVRANGLLLLVGGCVIALAAFGPPRTVFRRGGRLVAMGVMLAGFGAACAAIFAVHVAIADRAPPAAWAAAQADQKYIAPEYRAFLDGNTPFSPAVLWSAVSGYRAFMVADVRGIGLGDANSSTPLAWPAGCRPIVYRWDANGGTTAFVALIPNLIAWAVSLAGVIYGFGVAVSVARRRLRLSAAAVPLALLSLWLIFQASNVALSLSRAMYLYHYFIPLLAGWALAGHWLVDRGGARFVRGRAVIVTAILANFLVIAPLALHRPLTDQSCRWRTAINGTWICRH